MDFNDVISYMIIYSILGWIVESLYKTIRTKKLVNSGFLYGPFCPIYGFGALIMLLALKTFSSNIFLLFFMGFFILSIWEYIAALILEKVFKTKYWDYSTYKFNLNGRVCLTNSCFWGILTVIFIKLVHPPIESIISDMSIEVQMYINIILFIVFLIDFVFTVIKVYNINLNVYSLEKIKVNIKTQVEKIKQYAGTKAKESETIERMQSALEELKQKQEILKEKLDKQTQRLRTAFPTMKSMITEKIDSFRKKK